MTSDYILEQRVLGPHVTLAITQKRYEELSHAREVLSEALTFEQRYELLLGNFIAMELALTETCLRAKIEPQFGYLESAATLETANRHVVNLLTAMRGYVDQVVQDFKCLAINPSFGSLAELEITSTFNRSPDYRFMYSLRNHVQHKATAIHGLEQKSGMGDDANGWAELIKFFAIKTTLSNDRDFKKRVLDEHPEKIDVRRCARQSVHELGLTHLKLRDASSEHVNRARVTIQSAIQDYTTAGANSVLGLCARHVGNAAKDVPLLLNWDDVRLKLVEKNASPPQLWPHGNYKTPKAVEVTGLREKAGHTRVQAADLVCVSEERWQNYEEGLPMPEGLHHFYRLQVGLHPTHRLVPLHAADEQEPPPDL
ncbi:hypothetical protein LJR189_001065 [Acidovorax delafieldii]|uniref:hypothetical protein n=1 Tax=Acidovorax delafieldii TaxID=47920 RepID=UPI003ED0EE7F